jgi:hypothetical protein
MSWVKRALVVTIALCLLCMFYVHSDNVVRVVPRSSSMVTQVVVGSNGATTAPDELFAVLHHSCIAFDGTNLVVYMFGNRVDLSVLYYSPWVNNVFGRIMVLEASRKDYNGFGSPSFRNQTAFIGNHHHSDNNFHMFNDFLLPIWYRLVRMNEGLTATDALGRVLILLRGDSYRYSRVVVLFQLVRRLFGQLIYPLEDIKQPMCFKSIVIARDREPPPYYSHKGRFGAYANVLVPKFREWAMGTHKNSNNNVDINCSHARVTWVSRGPNGGVRGFENEPELLSWLNERGGMSVKVLAWQSVDAALESMRKTDVLVGAIGAGMAHGVLLGPGSVLIELQSSHFRGSVNF